MQRENRARGRATERLSRLGLLFAFAFGALASGCAPKIGSSCTQPTDCSAQGDRVCDSAQPGGYCTILNCMGNAGAACPDNAVCVEFGASVPGCPYNDYESPARTGLSFCMEHCRSDSDCRSGYVCRDPRSPPWNAAILDNNQSQSVCVAAPVPGIDSGSMQDGGLQSGVCSATLPELPDAFPWPVSVQDAGDAGSDGASDAGSDGASDAGSDGASDAGSDGASDAGSDGALDAAADAGPADAALGSTDATVDSGPADAAAGG